MANDKQATAYSMLSMMIQVYYMFLCIVGIWDQAEAISTLEKVEHQSFVAQEQEKDCKPPSSIFWGPSKSSKQCEYSIFTTAHE